jgi:hypothetical protein
LFFQRLSRNSVPKSLPDLDHATEISVNAETDRRLLIVGFLPTTLPVLRHLPSGGITKNGGIPNFQST